MDEQPVVPQPEATPTPAPDGKVYTPKPCVTCGEVFQPTSSREKWCPAHRPDKKTQKREQKQKERKRTKAKAEADSLRWNSTVELKPKEAREILETRGIRHPQVIDFCVQIAEQAARANRIPFNHYLMESGLRSALSKGKTKLPEIPDEIVDGEILYRRDLYTLYDYGFWRHPEVSFEQWLQDRYRLKTSTYELGHLLGKADFGETHKEWEKFLPRWQPRGLRPDYTQQDGLAWLGAQRSDTEGDKRRFLLVCSRNAFKSTWTRILALQFTICYPDGPILFLSETNRLSRKAMREFRGYLTLQPANPTMFQQYFGEYTVGADGDGSSLSYENPLAHLGLPQVACESSSMESANTGSRFTLCLADDPVSRDNGTANDEQKEAALAKYGSIARLREPQGMIINTQTPWAPGDLGDVMIKRNEEDPERGLAVRIDPVISIKPESAGKPLLELGPDDVVLNFLPKLDWKFVRAEMRSPEGIEFFKSQYLCQWPRPEDEGLTIEFTEADLRRATKGSAYFEGAPVLQTGIFCDTATSTSRYSDLSAIVYGKALQLNGKTVLAIADVRADRWKQSDLIKNIVDMVARYSPAFIGMERDRNVENFVDELRREILRRGLPLPFIRVVPVSIKPQAKFTRIKTLEIPLASGRLLFYHAGWNEDLYAQMTRFSGGPPKKSTALGKDDIPDAISGLFAAMKILRQDDEIPEDPETAAARREMDEREQKEIQKRVQYERIFGDHPSQQTHKSSDFLNDAQRQQMGLPPRNGPEPEPEPVRPVDPRTRVFGYTKVVQPSADRNTPFGIRGRWRNRG